MTPMVAHEEGESSVLRKICDAAVRGNVDKVRTLLQTTTRTLRQPNGVSQLDAPLFPETSLASSLRAHILMKESPLPPESVLRALLCVPSSYETPWKAAIDLVRTMHDQSTGTCSTSTLNTSNKTLWTSVTEIQSFLQQTVASWWKQETLILSATRVWKHPDTPPSERSTTTPRQWLEALTEAALEPLFEIESTGSGATSVSDNSHWMLPLELVSSIVSLFQDMDSTLETPRCLEGRIRKTLLRSPRIRPDRLLPWWTLALDVCQDPQGCIEEDDAIQMARTLRASWQEIPQADLPGMVRTVASLVVSREPTRDNAVSTIWHSLLLQLLQMASHDASTYSTVETVLQSSLDALPTPLLYHWKESLDCLQLESKIPTWVLANVNLLLLQAAERSGSRLVSSLVAHALKKRPTVSTSFDLREQCWATLVHFVFPQVRCSRVSRKRSRTDDVSRATHVMEQVRGSLHGVLYQGQGRFFRSVDDDGRQPFSLQLLCESLYLGHTQLAKQSYQFFAAERAQLWVNAANTVLCPSTTNCNWKLEEALLAVLIVVVVYQEVPASRKTLVRTMLQTFTQQQNPCGLQKLQCLALSVIIQSHMRSREASSSEDELRDLSPLSQVFSQAIPADVFQELATALSPLTPARHALLSTSRKLLRSPLGGGIWWGASLDGSRGAEVKREQIHSGVYGLCALLIAKTSAAEEAWDDCAVDAWVLLSDMIVLNEPALAVKERTWLYECIIGLATKGSFPPDTTLHLLRAVLVRLFHFFESSEGSKLRFDTSRIFSRWSSNSVGGMERKVLNDDIPALFSLLVFLLNCDMKAADPQSMERKQIVSAYHNRIARLLLAHRDESDLLKCQIQPLERANWFDEGKEQLCYKAACLSMMALLTFLTSHQNEARTNGDASEGIRERLVSELVLQEAAACRIYHDVVPNWTHGQTLASRDTSSYPQREDKEIRGMVSSAADVFVRVLLSPLWRISSDDEALEDTKTILLGVSSLIEIKREAAMKKTNVRTSKLETTRGRSDTRLPDVSFDHSTLAEASADLFELSTEMLSRAIQENWSVLETSAILNSSLVYCKAVPGLLHSSSSLPRRALLSLVDNVVSLYESVASEEASTLLIEYLEDNCLEGDGTGGSTEHERPLSLNALRTDDDIDEFVRHVRYTVMTALHASTIYVSHIAENVEKIFVEARPDALCAPFWISCFDVLCSDIRCGLKGDSGGLSDEIFLAFIDAITCISSILLTICEKGSVDIRSCLKVARCARNNGKILRTIMYRYPLRRSAPFKKTLMLTIHTLPSLHRRAYRVLCANIEEAHMDLLDLENDTFSIEVLHRSQEVLKKWIDLGLKSNTPWAEIVGLEQLNCDDTITVEESAMGQTSEAIPSVVVIPCQQKNRACYSDDTESKLKLKLPTKDTWAWAYSCSLLAMEQNWVESHRNLRHTTASEYTQNKALGKISPFAVYRKKELQCIMTATTEMLANHTVSRTGTPKEASDSKQTVKAAALPGPLKARLCSLLDRMTTVLLASVRRVASYLRAGRNADLTAVAEAVGCMSAWCLSSTDDGSDYVVGSRRWYKAEKVENSDRSILDRLPKVLYRMEELERSLQRLHGLLTKLKRTSSEGLQPNHTLDSLLVGYDRNEDSKSSTGGANTGSFCKTVQDKLAASSSQESFGMILVDSSLRSSKRQKQSAQMNRVRKARRQRVIRSRNQLVDEWLHLDQERGQDGGFDDDAYVDLEDFLVDG